MNLPSRDEKFELGIEEILHCVKKSQVGDRVAFSQLIDNFKEWIFFHLYRWVGEREEAQELAQEVFLKAYANLKNFRADAKFSTWLFQIALNLYRDLQKKQNVRERKQSQLYEEAQLVMQSESAEQKIQQKQLLDKLRRKILELPPHYRDAVQLRFLSEMSYQDCAEALGESLSSIKMRVARGVAALKESFSELEA